MRIFYTSKFAREYKKLPQDIKCVASDKEKIFRKNPFDKRLKTHKLHGKFSDFWSFSVTNTYRIIFEFDNNGVVYFHSIGDHDVYQ